MTQFIRPDSDTTVGSWTDPPLWSKLDDATPDDNTVIESDAEPTNSVSEVGLSNTTDPVGDTQTVRIRHRKLQSGNGSHSNVDLTVALMEGTTEIRSEVYTISGNDEDWYDRDFTLTSGEMNNISNYDNLSLRFTANQTGGARTGWAVISWAEMEVGVESVPQDVFGSLDVTSVSTISVGGAVEGAIQRVQETNGQNVGDLTLTLPSAPTEGNRLVVYIGHRTTVNNDPTISGSGWTLVALHNHALADTDDRRGIAVWTKEAGPSEPSSVTFNWDGVPIAGHFQEFTPTPQGVDAVSNAVGSVASPDGPMPLEPVEDGLLVACNLWKDAPEFPTENITYTNADLDGAVLYLHSGGRTLGSAYGEGAGTTVGWTGSYSGSVGALVSFYEPAAPSGYEAEVLADNPVGYWRLEETSGPTAIDSSGSGHHGDVIGGTDLNVAGQVGSAAEFDGVDSYIEVSDHADFNPGTDDFTIEHWFYQVWESESQEWMSKWGDTNVGWLRYRLRSDNLIRFDVRDPNGNTATATTPFGELRPADLSEAWHQMVVQRDGEVLRIFIDGQEVSTVDGGGDVHYQSVGSLNLTTDAPLHLGRRDSNFYKGFLDEVAFYDYALSPARIEAHYDAAITQPQITNTTTENTSGNSVTSLSFNHEHTGGLLVVMVGKAGGTDISVGATYNGSAMGSEGVTEEHNIQSYAFSLWDAPVGVHEVVITPSASTRMTVFAASIDNAGDIRASSVRQASSNPFSMSVVSDIDDLLIKGVHWQHSDEDVVSVGGELDDWVDDDGVNSEPSRGLLAWGTVEALSDGEADATSIFTDGSNFAGVLLSIQSDAATPADPITHFTRFDEYTAQTDLRNEPDWDTAFETFDVVDVRDDAEETNPLLARYVRLESTGPNGSLAWLEPGQSDRTQALMLFRRFETADSRAGVVTRTSDGDVIIHRFRNNTTECRIEANIDTVWTTSPSVAHGIADTVNTWLFIRAESIDGTHRMKVWPHGEPEPDAWLIEWSGASGLTQGFVGMQAPSPGIDVAFLSAGLNGAEAPEPEPPLGYESEVLSDNPVGYWRFEETSGTAAEDSSGNENHATVNNGDLNVSGAVGSAVGFNGTNSNVVLGTLSTDKALDGWTWEVWLNTQWSDVTVPGLFGEHTHVNPKALLRQFHESMSTWTLQVRFFLADETTSVSRNVSGMPYDETMHLAVTFEEAQTSNPIIRVFRDGTEIAFFDDIDAPILSPFQQQNLGTRDSGNHLYLGWMDEAAYYDYALSPARIEAHHNAAFAEPVIEVYGSVDVISTSQTIIDGVIDVLGGASITSAYILDVQAGIERYGDIFIESTASVTIEGAVEAEISGSIDVVSTSQVLADGVVDVAGGIGIESTSIISIDSVIDRYGDATLQSESAVSIDGVSEQVSEDIFGSIGIELISITDITATAEYVGFLDIDTASDVSIVGSVTEYTDWSDWVEQATLAAPQDVFGAIGVDSISSTDIDAYTERSGIASIISQSSLDITPTVEVAAQTTIESTSTLTVDGTIDTFGSVDTVSLSATDITGNVERTAAVEIESVSTIDIDSSIDATGSLDLLQQTSTIIAGHVEALTEVFGDVILTSTSTLSVDALIDKYSSADIEQLTVIDATGVVDTHGALDVLSVSILSIDGSRDINGTIALDTVASVDVEAASERFGAISLASSSTVGADGDVETVGRVDIVSESVVDIDASTEVYGGMGVEQDSSVVVDGVLDATGAINVTSESTLDVFGMIDVQADISIDSISSVEIIGVAVGETVGDIDISSTTTVDVDGLSESFGEIDTVSTASMDIEAHTEVYGTTSIISASDTSIAGIVVEYTDWSDWVEQSTGAPEIIASIDLVSTSTVSADASTERFGAIALESISTSDIDGTTVGFVIGDIDVESTSLVDIDGLLEAGSSTDIVSTTETDIEGRADVFGAIDTVLTSSVSVDSTTIGESFGAIDIESDSLVNIDVVIESTSDITLDSQSTVLVDGIAAVFGETDIASASTISVDGAIELFGDVSVSSTSSTDINGAPERHGDIDADSTSDIDVSGHIEASGTIDIESTADTIIVGIVEIPGEEFGVISVSSTSTTDITAHAERHASIDVHQTTDVTSSGTIESDGVIDITHQSSTDIDGVTYVLGAVDIASQTTVDIDELIERTATTTTESVSDVDVNGIAERYATTSIESVTAVGIAGIVDELGEEFGVISITSTTDADIHGVSERYASMDALSTTTIEIVLPKIKGLDLYLFTDSGDIVRHKDTSTDEDIFFDIEPLEGKLSIEDSITTEVYVDNA